MPKIEKPTSVGDNIKSAAYYIPTTLVLEPGGVLLNYISSMAAMGGIDFGKFKGSSQTEKFTPEKQRELFDDYRKGPVSKINYASVAEKLEKNLDEYNQARMLNFAQFITQSEKDALPEKDKEKDPEKQAVTTRLKEAAQVIGPKIKLTSTELSGDIKEHLNAFDHAGTLTSLYNLRYESEKQLNEQLTKDKDEIEHVFASGDLADNASALDLPIIKQDMLKILKATHNKALAALDKSFTEEITKVHAAEQQKEERITWLLHLMENPENRKKIEELARQAAKPKNQGAELLISSYGSPEKELEGLEELTDEDIKKLGSIATMTSRNRFGNEWLDYFSPLSRRGQINFAEGGGVQMNLPNRIWDSFY